MRRRSGGEQTLAQRRVICHSPTGVSRAGSPDLAGYQSGAEDRRQRRAGACDRALRFVPWKHREEIDEAAKYYANKELPFLTSQ
jgi:hypothetical protein